MYSANVVAQPRPSLLKRTRISGKMPKSFKKRDIRNINHAGVARCLRVLRATRHTKFKLRDFQRIAGLKSRGLSKAFTLKLGYSPGVLLRAARLEMASNLLRKQNISIEVLARRCGYRSTNSLWVAFKRETGITPAQYRAMHSSNVSLMTDRTSSRRRF